MTSGYVSVDGAELAWTSHRQGRPLLLIHAGIADQAMWDPVIARLHARVRAVTSDMRGFGSTRAAGARFSPADDAHAVLKRLGLGAAHVVGASYGGQVALELAATHPSAVASLTLFAPAVADATWSRRLEQFAADEEKALAEGRIDDAVELNLDTWLRGADERHRQITKLRNYVASAVRRGFELQAEADIEPEEFAFAELAGAVAKDLRARIAVGDDDDETFRAIASRLARDVLRSARVTGIADCGHLAPLERPDRCAELIVETIRASREPPSVPTRPADLAVLQRRKPPLEGGTALAKITGGDLLSQACEGQVPSAL